MNVILNYVVNHIYKESGKSLKESLSVLDKMFEDKSIDENTLVKLNIDGRELSLKDFLLQRYNENMDNDIIDLLKKHTKIELGDRDAFLTLLNVLRSLKVEYILHKADESINYFLSLNIPAIKIVNYINNNYDKEYDEIKNEHPATFFNLILKSILNIQLFEKIMVNYLGVDNIRENLEKHISKEYLGLTFSNSTSVVNLCNAYPELRGIKVKSNKSFIQELILNSPDTINSLDLTNEEKKELIDLYFKEKIEVYNPVLSSDEMIFSRPEWYRTKCGTSDVLGSYVSSHAFMGVDSVFKRLDKKIQESGDLKKFILSRPHNLLLEYLLNDRNKISYKHLKKITKKFPELLERECHNGFLESKISGRIKDADFDLAIIKELPSNILLTSDPSVLAEWVDSVLFFDYSSHYNFEEINFFEGVKKLIIDSIKNNFEETNEDVSKVLLKIKLQEDIHRILKNAHSVIFENTIEFEIDKLIKSYSFSYKELKSMDAIDSLMINGYLANDYLMKMKTNEEKEMILSSINEDAQEDGLKSKKRI